MDVAANPANTSSTKASACCSTTSIQSCTEGRTLDRSSDIPIRLSKNFFIKHDSRLHIHALVAILPVERTYDQPHRKNIDNRSPAASDPRFLASKIDFNDPCDN